MCARNGTPVSVRGPRHAFGGRAFALLELLRVLRVAAEVAGEQDRVDLSGAEQGADDAREAVDVLLASAGEVDGIDERRRRRQRSGELGPRRLGELRQLEARSDDEVGGDHRVPAAVGRERDAPSRRPPVREEAHGHVHDLLRRGDELDARAQAGRADRLEVAGQCARVGARRAGARLGGAAGQENDRRPRLDGGLPGAGELAPVAEVLEVDGDQPRGLVRGERLDQLGRLDVRLVPERDEAREAEPELGAHHADLEREVSALRDEADRAGLELLRAKLEPRAGVVDAEAIRPDEDGAGGAHALDDGALAGRSLLPHLAEPGADEDDAPRAGGERGVDRLLGARGRDGDDDELGRLRKLSEGRVGLPARRSRRRCG